MLANTIIVLSRFRQATPDSGAICGAGRLHYTRCNQHELDQSLLCVDTHDLVTCAGPDGPHLDSARSVELAVRTIATVGNYDYIITVR